MSPLIVGIAGGTASGKTRLAKYVAQKLGNDAVTVTQDWYYRDRSMLSPGERRLLNFDHPAAFDHALLLEQLRALRAGETVRAPNYNYTTHQRSLEGVWLRPAPVILVEGLLVLHDPVLRQMFDYSVFVDVPADLRLVRRLRRDAGGRGRAIKETLRLYEYCVRTMHESFVQPSAQYATLIWHPEQDAEFPVKLVQRIRKMLTGPRSSPKRSGEKR
jgi:uridine kinase